MFPASKKYRILFFCSGSDGVVARFSFADMLWRRCCCHSQVFIAVTGVCPQDVYIRHVAILVIAWFSNSFIFPNHSVQNRLISVVKISSSNKFEVRTVSCGPSFLPLIYGPSVKKRGSATYSTDRENEVSKIFVISLRLIRRVGKKTTC